MTVDLILVVIVMWVVVVPVAVFVVGLGVRMLDDRRRDQAYSRATLSCAQMRRPLRAARFDRRRSAVLGLARGAANRPAQRR